VSQPEGVALVDLRCGAAHRADTRPLLGRLLAVGSDVVWYADRAKYRDDERYANKIGTWPSETNPRFGHGRFYVSPEERVTVLVAGEVDPALPTGLHFTVCCRDHRPEQVPVIYLLQALQAAAASEKETLPIVRLWPRRAC
jgi:hypothetical protein